jgi:hypothetical protein
MTFFCLEWKRHTCYLIHCDSVLKHDYFFTHDIWGEANGFDGWYTMHPMHHWRVFKINIYFLEI